MSIFYSHLKMFSLLKKNHLALYHNNRTTSYGELFRKTISLNHYLYNKFGEDKSCFVVYLENGIDLAEVLISLDYLNVNIILVHNDTSIEDLLDIFKDIDSQVLITTRKLLSSFRSFFENINIEIIEEIDCTDVSQSRKVSIENNNCKIIFYTSGTSGKPKGVIFPKYIFQTATLRNFREQKKVYLNTRPLYFKAHFSLFTLYIQSGHTIILQSKEYNEETLYDHIERFNPSVIIISPYELSALLAYISDNNKQLPKHVNEICCLGSSVSKKLVDNFAKLCNCRFTTIYGTTETGAISYNSDLLTSDVKSVGNILMGVDVKVLSDKGQELEVKQIGEIAIKSKEMIESYLGSSIPISECMFKGYFLTGDLGYVNDRNELFILSRKNGRVNKDGNQLYIQDIEDVMEQLDFIRECIVYYQKKDIKDKIVAFVQLSKGINYKDVKQQLKFYLDLKLPKYMHPDEIIIVSAFKPSPSGKFNTQYLDELVNSKY
ncbi:fatty acid--CoA ligase family protein [Bacillus sp. REN10]|uniref:class I adenylate-forming enzyme family protein n=1 Tax=Bacillus sp. REN10 TaxID=2782541 RepID=UPI00193C45C7|nr:fatty acid--CoA ligase family protein [Bacillus sp. REN10]